MAMLTAGSGGSGAASPLDVDNIRIANNTISSTNANGNIVLDPNGTGIIQATASVQLTAGGLLVYAADEEKVQVAGGAGGTLLSSETDIRWYNDPDISSGSPDVGLKRVAAGTLQGTNGTTGNMVAFLLTPTVGIFQGSGSPEGVITAGVGAIYLRVVDGGAGSSFYVKESGSGNTGWVAK